ncbi:MAG TPA: class I SAM-dependent methyltransferase [Pyrinomonadaceae bacterium]|nr:class I SAM-dependent methyltransferase [Pyrinomonadaceae bacterium]
MTPFEEQIKDLDLSLFSKIPSQSTDEDKRSLLAVQLGVRETVGEYRYLEIGSYLGGSIQPHLLDPLCTQIVSIDKRPPSQPDERGIDYVYKNNSTARMMERLGGVSADLTKVATIDGDSRSIPEGAVERGMTLCFIDGEHTDEASVADFEFCYRVVDRERGAIAFHDAQITYNGIAACVEKLEEEGADFRAYALPNALFVIELGSLRLSDHPAIRERLTQNYRSYLYSLQENDHFRQFATGFPFGAVRRLMVKLRGGNISE